MKRIYRIVVLVLVVAGVSLAASRTLLAQANAPAPVYVVNEINVTDAAAFADYAKRQGALVAAHGGRFLARRGKVEAITGAPPRSGVTIYVFPSMENAKAWLNAPEQKELQAVRDKGSDFRAFMVVGCGDCGVPASK